MVFSFNGGDAAPAQGLLASMITEFKLNSKMRNKETTLQMAILSKKQGKGDVLYVLAMKGEGCTLHHLRARVNSSNLSYLSFVERYNPGYGINLGCTFQLKIDTIAFQQRKSF